MSMMGEELLKERVHFAEGVGELVLNLRNLSDFLAQSSDLLHERVALFANF
jgi:hypothetical protein